MAQRDRPTIPLTRAMMEAGESALRAWWESDQWYDEGAAAIVRAALTAGGFQVVEQPLKRLAKAPQLRKPHGPEPLR